jgi:hypothetical protein
MTLNQKHTTIISIVIFLGFLTLFAYTSSRRHEVPVPIVTNNTASTTNNTATSSEQSIPQGAAPATEVHAPGTTVSEQSRAPAAVTSVATTTEIVRSQFPWKRAIATVFWVGEGETADNDYINNRASAWDENWQQSFGGFDDPDKRCGYQPCAFTPKQNPFYIALPYIERNEDDTVKASARTIPWYSDALFVKGTLIKDHWVEVKTGGTSCYAQWEDVGPFETDDFAYVFGSASTPKNIFDAAAGIDLSPAMRDCLKVGDVSTVEWRFVDVAKVPNGPWIKVTRTP